MTLTLTVTFVGVACPLPLLLAVILRAMVYRKDLEKKEGDAGPLKLRVWMLHSLFLKSIVPVLRYFLVEGFSPQPVERPSTL